ncbi:hypothetical protein, partial [Magnetococcus sp. PR-3]
MYEWLKRPKLEPSQRSKCDRKLKKEELLAHVVVHPDALQRESRSLWCAPKHDLCSAQSSEY